MRGTTIKLSLLFLLLFFLCWFRSPDLNHMFLHDFMEQAGDLLHLNK